MFKVMAFLTACMGLVLQSLVLSATDAEVNAINPARDLARRNLNSFVRTRRLDDFDAADAARTKTPVALAFCSACKLGRRMDDGRPWPDDSYALGLLLRGTPARAEPAATERRYCASVARPGG